VRAAEVEGEEPFAFPHDGDAELGQDERTVDRDLLLDDPDGCRPRPSRPRARSQKTPEAGPPEQEEA
jgi:hypothetical protein